MSGRGPCGVGPKRLDQTKSPTMRRMSAPMETKNIFIWFLVEDYYTHFSRSAYQSRTTAPLLSTRSRLVLNVLRKEPDQPDTRSHDHVPENQTADEIAESKYVLHRRDVEVQEIRQKRRTRCR